MADGLPEGLDGIAALGNAVVPQIAEWIGRRLMEVERCQMIP
jgi:site-specific DNA-cytosine methylase